MIVLNQATTISLLVALSSLAVGAVALACAIVEQRKAHPDLILFDVYRCLVLFMGFTTVSALAFCWDPRLFYDDYLHSLVTVWVLWFAILFSTGMFLWGRWQEHRGHHALQARASQRRRRSARARVARER